MNSRGCAEDMDGMLWNISGNMRHPSEHGLNHSTGFQTCTNSSCQLSSSSTCPYNIIQLILIVIVIVSLTVVTILGNILVILSIKVNRKLRTINNYFLLSLACADLITGLFSMNLYSLYIVMGYWPLGAIVCDLWLVLDYVVGSASVMNLLIISFDRYFCVTQPLSYPARRTPKLAGLMIAAAWLFPLLLWAPAILCWQPLTGKRVLRGRECYIQLLSSPTVTLGTTLLSFYLPAVVMICLYTRISLASWRRLGELQLERRAAGTSSGSIKRFLLKTRTWVAAEPETRTSSDTLNESVEAEAEVDTKLRNFTKLTKTLQELSEQTDGAPTSAINSAVPDFIETGIHLSSRSNSHAASQHAGEVDYGTLTKIQRPHIQEPFNTFPSFTKCQDRRRHRILARERKVTKTILAILLAFLLTWMPYNVMAVIGTFCHFCIPNTLWTLGYWLCYVNSTINPGCYAMCNITFRKTFRRLLRCERQKATWK